MAMIFFKGLSIISNEAMGTRESLDEQLSNAAWRLDGSVLTNIAGLFIKTNKDTTFAS